MRKILPLGGLIVINIILSLLTSCGKDETITEGAPPTLSVSATIVNGAALNDNGTVVATDTIDFFIDVNAPAGFNSILIGGSGHSEITSGEVPSDSAVINDINFRVTTVKDDGEATATYIFVAVDDLGQTSDSVTFSFSVSPIVDSFSNLTLGGFQNTTTNGFLNAIENIVYSLNTAVLNSDKVDLLFYHATTPGYSIAAADDSNADATLQSQTVTGDLDDFSVQNQTRFKSFSGNPGFDAIRSVEDLENAFASNGTSGLSQITGLTGGRVFGFQLATSRGDRLGIVRINGTAGTNATSRAINLDYKIEPK